MPMSMPMEGFFTLQFYMVVDISITLGRCEGEEGRRGKGRGRMNFVLMKQSIA